MNNHRTLPLERIVHRTGSMPFSLHRTVVNSGETDALYLHCHNEAEFFFLDEGSISFNIENRSFQLTAGDAMFIPPNLIHNAGRTCAPEAPCSYHALVFSPEILSEFFAGYETSYFTLLQTDRIECICPIYSAAASNACILGLLKDIFAYIDCNPETYELSLTGKLLICWQELYNHFLAEKTVTLSERRKNCVELQRSLDYIMEHYSEPLTLSELSTASGFSEGYYSHIFRDFTGYTPFEYLNRVRIVKSCALLASTNKKITDIALLSGFNNVSYFNRTFFSIIGMTPSDYRKK